jgi:hypothetical protein
MEVGARSSPTVKTPDRLVATAESGSRGATPPLTAPATPTLSDPTISLLMGTPMAHGCGNGFELAPAAAPHRLETPSMLSRRSSPTRLATSYSSDTGKTQNGARLND